MSSVEGADEGSPAGPAAGQGTGPEARADALEQQQMAALNAAVAHAQLSPSAVAALDPHKPEHYPTVSELEELITTRPYRRGVGRGFWNRNGGAVTRLPPLPAAPTLADFFALRLPHTANHCLQSANKALLSGADEEIVLACLLHDIVQEIMCADHGHWGAQLVEPYVSERVAFAIKHHQALRFFADEEAGYVYPAIYRRLYGVDYVPDERLQQTYQFARGHHWYGAARQVTVNDLYAFDPKAVVTFEKFVDIVGRHFRQPEEGLGNDDSPVAHMWRTIAYPDGPL
jgi:hypothetical protein